MQDCQDGHTSGYKAYIKGFPTFKCQIPEQCWANSLVRLRNERSAPFVHSCQPGGHLRSARLSWERMIVGSIPCEFQTPTQVPLTTNKTQRQKLLFSPLSGFLNEYKKKLDFFWLPRAANA